MTTRRATQPDKDYSRPWDLDFHDDSRKTTASFKCYIGHLDLIHAAAHRVGLSSASYMRRIVLTQAAADLGIAPPEHASLETARERIAAAARAEGLTPQEYTFREAERAALRALRPAAVADTRQRRRKKH